MYGLPRDLRAAYKNHPEWVDVYDLLGIPNLRKFVSYADAKRIVQDAGLITSTQFNRWIKKEGKGLGVPSQPQLIYSDLWQGYGEFLGTGNIYRGDWVPYDEAVRLVRRAKIRTSTEFNRWIKNEGKGLGIPSNPQKVYTDLWQGWGQFLGTGNYRYGNWLPYDKAVRLVRRAKIRKYNEFKQWIKNEGKGSGVPSHPHVVYKDQWRGIGDFLGTGNVKGTNQYSKSKTKKPSRPAPSNQDKPTKKSNRKV